MTEREAAARWRVLAEWEARLDEQHAQVWQMTDEQLVAHRREQERYLAAVTVFRDQAREARI